MALNPILLIVWGVLAIAFGGLLIYRGQLTRYEDEQLYIAGSASQQSMEEHNQLVTRVEKLQPVLMVVGAAAALMTALTVGVYVWEAVRTLF